MKNFLHGGLQSIFTSCISLRYDSANNTESLPSARHCAQWWPMAVEADMVLVLRELSV